MAGCDVAFQNAIGKAFIGFAQQTLFCAAYVLILFCISWFDACLLNERLLCAAIYTETETEMPVVCSE